MADREELDRVFKEITPTRGKEYTDKLRVVVEENEKRGRLDYFLNESNHHTLCEYVKRIVHQYDEKHEYIESLQTGRDAHAWETVHQQAQLYATKLLMRFGFAKGLSSLVAEDISQDVCIIILHAHYPYDSDLNAWIYVVVVNVCRKYARQMRLDEKKKIDIELVEYVLHENLYQLSDTALDLRTTQVELNEAIRQLSQNQQDVIIAHYLLEKSLAEITEEVGISRNTLYKRHYDALRKLGKILGSDRH